MELDRFHFGNRTSSLGLLLLILSVPSLSFLLTPPSLSSRGNQKSLKRVIIPQSQQQDDLLEQQQETNNLNDDNEDDSSTPICRIVSRADSKLPTSASILPESLFQEPHLLEKLDAYYNAQAYKRTKRLSYLQQQSNINSKKHKEDRRLVSFVKESLEDAGFQLLSRRDLDLCDSLNVGYLLRLSISPDVADLDPGIVNEFYPEQYYNNGTRIANDEDEVLFEGRCLVYWRGYSKEVTTGRLILPKFDYLQTSLVQRSTTWVKKRLDEIEMNLSANAEKQNQKLQSKLKDIKSSVLPDALSSSSSSTPSFSSSLVDTTESLHGDNSTSTSSSSSSSSSRVNLGRYGGKKLQFVSSADPDDALDPFMICEVDVDIDDSETMEEEMYDKLNNNNQGYTCEYDEKMTKTNQEKTAPRMHLLERVSINNLVNVFTKYGRRTLLRTLFAKSKLVEPTYEEVVVIWRPLEQKQKKPILPKFVREYADMFDIQGFEPEEQDISSDLEIRNFQRVPMSNIQAVLPKTKLVFRPADALLFDMISLITFALVAGSVRLDSPRLDLLALISVSLWIIRTVIRYSNKLARYDLLVKNFLTSKISHRNEGALKYLTSEAGLQRAIRASLVLSWVSTFFSNSKEQDPAPSLTTDTSDTVILPPTYIKRSSIQNSLMNDVNSMLDMDMEVQINVDRALNDLEEVALLKFSENGEEIINVTDTTTSVDYVKDAWNKLLLEREDIIDDDDDDNDDDIDPNSNNSEETLSKRARNFLLSKEENKKRIALIKAAQKKGYEKVKEAKKLIEQSEAIKEVQKKGYEKVEEAKKMLEERKKRT